eukprot:302059-Chlamydomonas_euryale.AAC.4
MDCSRAWPSNLGRKNGCLKGCGARKGLVEKTNHQHTSWGQPVGVVLLPVGTHHGHTPRARTMWARNAYGVLQDAC